MDRRTLLKAGLGGAALSVAAPYVSARAARTLRFAHFAAEDHPAHIAAKEFVANVIPGITVVPSGVWCLNRAQEAGCTYCAGG